MDKWNYLACQLFDFSDGSDMELKSFQNIENSPVDYLRERTINF